jgi:hypothetical protein
MPDKRHSDVRPRVHARLVYVGLALGTIALGLMVHVHGDALGPASRDVIGDALWAAMIMWWISAIAPDRSLGARGIVAIAICFAVEFSQLYHTGTLDSLRNTIIGRLTLGSGFDPRDLLAYAIGVLAAAACERIVRSRTVPQHAPS